MVNNFSPFMELEGSLQYSQKSAIPASLGLIEYCSHTSVFQVRLGTVLPAVSSFPSLQVLHINVCMC